MDLVVDGYEGVMWGEGAGRPLSMDKQGRWFSVNPVFLHLGYVVRDIVDHVHIKVVRGGVEDLRKRLRVRSDDNKQLLISHK